MQAGELCHKITIESFTSVRKSGGGRTKTYATLKQVFAKVKPTRSYERQRGEQFENVITHKITIRYDSGLNVTTKHRIKFGSRYFAIKGVINIDERNEWIEIEAQETAEEASQT